MGGRADGGINIGMCERRKGKGGKRERERERERECGLTSQEE